MTKPKNCPNIRLSIELAVLLLMATGTVFVYSAGANVRTDYDLQRFYEFTTFKQMLLFPIAVLVMYAASTFNYRWLSLEKGPFKSLSPFLLLFTTALLILVLIPGIGVGIGQNKDFARRWIEIPLGSASVTFQPSELSKWALVFFLAAFTANYDRRLKSYLYGFLPICIIAAIPIALIVTQDFGTAAFMALLTFLMLIIGGAKWWHFATPMPVILPAFYLAIISSPTRINRITAFINPDANLAANYQANQSLIAISGGGIWGKGLGKGISKFGHVPEDTTDFIFSIIAEEFGFIGALWVILLFTILIILSIIVIYRCRDRFSKLLAAGITLTITIQAAINIGVVTVVLPTKGIGLPFVSAGGTSMLLFAAAVGLLLNIAKQTENPKGYEKITTAPAGFCRDSTILAGSY